MNNDSIPSWSSHYTVSDYIEIAYNLTAIIIGVPINVWVLRGHVISLRNRPAHARLIWLGVNLTIGNLMSLLVHSAGTVIWLLTFYWYGGDLLCRSFKCLSVMSFHISSNVVVSIALDMFSSLYSPLRNRARDGMRRVRYLLIASWSLATFSAVPQLYLWGEEIDELDRTKRLCVFLFDHYITFTRTYSLAHLLLVFYIPFLFILFCYVASGYYVWKHLRLRAQLHEEVRRGESIEKNVNAGNQNFLSISKKRNSSPNFERQTKTKMKLLRKSSLVIFSYVVCWLPYQIFSMWQLFCDSDCELKHYEIINTKLRWLEALMISCACINPFLYTFVHRGPKRSFISETITNHASSEASPRNNQSFQLNAGTRGGVRV